MSANIFSELRINVREDSEMKGSFLRRMAASFALVTALGMAVGGSGTAYARSC